jgi:hypothetical protein
LCGKSDKWPWRWLHFKVQMALFESGDGFNVVGAGEVDLVHYLRRALTEICGENRIL